MEWKKLPVWKKGLAVGVALSLTLLAGMGGFCWWLFHRTPGQYFDSKGLPIYYTDEGQGEPVILVHGVAANADLNWRRPGVTRLLAKEFRVITFDLRGHGRSGKPDKPEDYGAELYEDIVRLMDHLHIEKAHVAGYSLGGFLTLKLAATHPDRLKSVAICAAGWADPATHPDIPNPYASPKLTQAPLYLNASAAPDGILHGIVQRIRSDIGEMILPKKVKQALKTGYPLLGVEQSALESIRVPALCVIGTSDGLLSLARALKTHLQGLEYTEIPGTDHLWMPANGVFQKTLLEFLREQTRGKKE